MNDDFQKRAKLLKEQYDALIALQNEKIVEGNGVHPRPKPRQLLEVADVAMHTDECLLSDLHGHVVVEEVLVPKVVDPLVPELDQLTLGTLVPLTGPGNEGVRMHHSNVEKSSCHWKTRFLPGLGRCWL